VNSLRQELKPHGLDVALRKTAIDREVFKKDALQSNKITIAGKTLEEWLVATTGQSKCCDACGDAECRTVEYAGDTHEAIPAELIVRAGLKAAAYEFRLKVPERDRQIPLVMKKNKKR
jgi:hypothetical protein